MAKPRSKNFIENSSYPSKSNRLTKNPISNPEEDDPEIDNLGSSDPLYLEKLRKIKAEANQIELKNAIMLKDYLPTGEVKAAVAQDYMRVRTKLLSLRPKILKSLLSMTDINEATTYFDTEIAEILSELSYEKELLE
jgi:hypothetical protein